MPARFLDEHITCLKRVMLPRFPECKFTQEDYEEVMKETGLNQAQVDQWAKHLRFRLPVDEDRKAFLVATGKPEKVRWPRAILWGLDPKRFELTQSMFDRFRR